MHTQKGRLAKRNIKKRKIQLIWEGPITLHRKTWVKPPWLEEREKTLKQKEFGKGCADCPAWQEEHSHLIWMALGIVTGMIVAAITIWRIL